MVLNPLIHLLIMQPKGIIFIHIVVILSKYVLIWATLIF